jgi:cold shock CspA family protein/ribosome-associated translation inhibitor RaiA
MQSPVQIEFDGLPPSDAVTARIQKRIDHLEKLFPNIVDARVVVGLAHHHHRKGNLFQVRIELGVPKDRLIINRDPGKNAAHADAYVAIRDAFDAMERVLQDYARKLRLDVKHHDTPLISGSIRRLFPYEGYGFIATDDERDVYFDANAVVDSPFDKLEVGARVRFCEELGEKGPQATTVYA